MPSIVALRQIGDNEFRVADPLNCPFRYVNIGRKMETACNLDKDLRMECPDYTRFPEGCKLKKGVIIKS